MPLISATKCAPLAQRISFREVHTRLARRRFLAFHRDDTNSRRRCEAAPLALSAPRLHACLTHDNTTNEHERRYDFARSRFYRCRDDMRPTAAVVAIIGTAPPSDFCFSLCDTSTMPMMAPADVSARSASR